MILKVTAEEATMIRKALAIAGVRNVGATTEEEMQEFTKYMELWEKIYAQINEQSN